MPDIETRFGIIKNADITGNFPEGSPQCVLVYSESILEFPFGTVEPQYLTEDMGRRRHEAVYFHMNGNIKSLPLQQQYTISTPIGEFPAELLTFHKDGSLRKIFPLNGRINGFWAWKQEAEYAKESQVTTPIGSISAKLLSIHFHEDGALRSLTMCPGEIKEIETPFGKVKARIGIAFHEDGSLRSFEPEEPLEVNTVIGKLTAFDPDPEGITGDYNSLILRPDGSVKALYTTDEKITVTDPKGQKHIFSPKLVAGYCSDAIQQVSPLRIEFAEGKVRFDRDASEEFEISECQFDIEPSNLDAKRVFLSCAD